MLTALPLRPTARAHAAKFSRRLAHRIVPHAGHNLPQEEPDVFAGAVMEMVRT